jgi:hypothetical protein
MILMPEQLSQEDCWLAVGTTAVSARTNNKVYFKQILTLFIHSFILFSVNPIQVIT